MNFFHIFFVGDEISTNDAKHGMNCVATTEEPIHWNRRLLVNLKWQTNKTCDKHELDFIEQILSHSAYYFYHLGVPETTGYTVVG